MTVEELLAENRRRIAEMEKPFDPVGTGGEDRSRLLTDFTYWAAKTVRIKPKGGGEEIPFILNRPQRKLVDALEDMRRNNKPIRLILLKARQWGGSTCVQIYMAWLQMVHAKGLNSLIVAHFHGASAQIRDMFDRMLRSYPVELIEEAESESFDDGTGQLRGQKKKKKPKLTENVGQGGNTIRLIPRDCKMTVASAESPESMRGGDYNLVHCSEVGLWKSTRLRSPEQIVRSACSGVLYRPLTMIVYESTANGTGTFFHTEYEAAKRGESLFVPLFVAWHEIEQYQLPFRSDMEEEEFARALLEGRESDTQTSSRRQPGKYLWWLWQQGASLRAINWYVHERAKYSDHGQMAAEYPSDDVEAFVHSGARVFDKYKVEEMRKECRPPAKRGEIQGRSPLGKEACDDVRFVEDKNGALAVWKLPETDPMTYITNRYLVTVDIGGRSARSDWSVIAVFDRARMRGGIPPEIVAQWRGHIDFDLLAWKAASIATFYDKALLVIESNTLESRDPLGHEGDQSQFIFTQLRDAYPNLYARRRSSEDVARGAPCKYGFHTNMATKPMIISTLVSAIRDGAYVERDEGCLAEYLTYEQKENGSYGALPGHHDDMLMTRAIGLHICFHEMEMPRMKERGENGYQPPAPFSFANIWT